MRLKKRSLPQRPLPNPKPQIPSKQPNPNFKMEDGAKPRDLEDRTFRFAESIRRFVKQLPRAISNVGDVRQLIRAFGTSRKTTCSIAAVVLFTTATAVFAEELPRKS